MVLAVGIKYYKIILATVMTGIIANEGLNQRWGSALACMPFLVTLLPQFEQLAHWSFRQKYMVATSLLVLMLPLILISNFTYMLFKVGVWGASTDTLIKAVYCLLVAVCGQLCATTKRK